MSTRDAEKSSAFTQGWAACGPPDVPGQQPPLSLIMHYVGWELFIPQLLSFPPPLLLASNFLYQYIYTPMFFEFKGLKAFTLGFGEVSVTLIRETVYCNYIQ